MGARVVRSHSLGISTGGPEFHGYGIGWREGMIWGELGGSNRTEENFASMDYAIYRAGQLGLRLVIPLTNGWNMANGGILDFLGWRGLADPCLGGEHNLVAEKGQRCEDEFYINKQVGEDFRAYVATILNHLNPHTGLHYKEDPTIMAWESGNELYFPPFQWTINLAKYIKEELGAVQLFMDGKHISVPGVGWYPELEDPVRLEEFRKYVDIISDHAYPMDAGVVEELKSLGLLSGSLFWSMFGHAEQYGHVTHTDGFTLYWPTGPAPEVFHYNQPAFKALMLNFSDHMFLMSNTLVPTSYPLSMEPPLITSLECKAGQWVKLGFRGVAGAHLYKVSVDGHALAFIEDQQAPTYIHNSVVVNGSEVVVRPYGYGEVRVEGTLSRGERCPLQF